MENCCERYLLKGTWFGGDWLEHSEIEILTFPMKITNSLNPRLNGKARTMKIDVQDGRAPKCR
jgi:hypothetical protein